MLRGLLIVLAQAAFAQTLAPVAPALPLLPPSPLMGPVLSGASAPSLVPGIVLPAPLAPTLAPTLGVPASPAEFRAPAAAASPVPEAEVAARALASSGKAEHATGGRRFELVLRRGTNEFGHEVLVIDAVDAAAPGKGTVAHIDFSVNSRYGQARLDGPLDGFLKGGRPGELSHNREHLWFGLAVLPEYRDLRLGKLLLEVSVAMLRERGIPELYIYATESSKSFYLKHLAGRVSFAEPFIGADEATYYRIRVDLGAR